MPELPEVQTVLDGVIQSVGNLKILSLLSYYPGTVILPPESSDHAFPSRIVRFDRRGKYMIFGLDSGYSLIIHLRMTGKLVWDDDHEPALPHERAALVIEGGKRLRFIDPRTFGKITLCPSSRVQQILPGLGEEPLEKGFTAIYLKQKLSRRKIPIKNALLDQSVVAGLGNIYVCEILYRAGIHPDRESDSLAMPSLKKIVSHTKEVLSEALANNGTSISDFRRVDDKEGGFQEFLRVYQKQLCPLGHPVQRVKHSGRSTYFCPLCQK